VGDEVIKPYTPTTLDSDIGYFELVIKVIFRYHVFDVFINFVITTLLVQLSFMGFSLIRCTHKEECLIIFVR
jgi:hypothetical protein